MALLHIRETEALARARGDELRAMMRSPEAWQTVVIQVGVGSNRWATWLASAENGPEIRIWPRENPERYDAEINEDSWEAPTPQAAVDAAVAGLRAEAAYTLAVAERLRDRYSETTNGQD